MKDVAIGTPRGHTQAIVFVDVLRRIGVDALIRFGERLGDACRAHAFCNQPLDYHTDHVVHRESFLMLLVEPPQRILHGTHHGLSSHVVAHTPLVFVVHCAGSLAKGAQCDTFQPRRHLH